jgi:predicted FMN-binding regulatory protein PaiB
VALADGSSSPSGKPNWNKSNDDSSPRPTKAAGSFLSAAQRCPKEKRAMTYLPSAFHETRPDVLEAFIRKHSFATLISNGADGIAVSHLPMLLERDAAGQRMLVGHLARANPQWRDLTKDVLVIFSGPHTYISPRWYETQVAVPTWNYTTVYVRGRARGRRRTAALA